MSTFVSPTDQVPLTTSRAASVNNLDAATATAFALLPTESDLYDGTTNYVVTTGSAGAYLSTTTYSMTSFEDGMLLVIKASHSSPGASTIDVNGLGVKSIRRNDGTAIAANDMISGKFYAIRYNAVSGYFELMANLNVTAPSFTLLDEDDMASDDNANGATQQSIKAYGDSATQTMTNKTLTSPVINTSISGTAVLDEDDMSSDSATKIATQQSIKAYADAGRVEDLLHKTAAYTAVAGDRVACDTADTAAFTVELPLNPTRGDWVVISDAVGNASTDNITVDRNGQKIVGAAEDFIINFNWLSFKFIFNDATYGWYIGS